MHLDERMPATRKPPSRANGRGRSAPRCSGATAGESITKHPTGFGGCARPPSEFTGVSVPTELKTPYVSRLRACAKTSAGQEAYFQQNDPHPDPLPSDGRGNNQTRLSQLPKRLDTPTVGGRFSHSHPIGYLFTVGSTGDSPVPSGDPPDGTERGIESNNAVFSHSGYTTTLPASRREGRAGRPHHPR